MKLIERVIGKRVVLMIRQSDRALTIFALIAANHVDMAHDEIEEEPARLEILIVAINHRPKRLVSDFESLID